MNESVSFGRVAEFAKAEAMRGSDCGRLVDRVNEHFGYEIVQIARSVPGVQIHYLPTMELIDLTVVFDQS